MHLDCGFLAGVPKKKERESKKEENPQMAIKCCFARRERRANRGGPICGARRLFSVWPRRGTSGSITSQHDHTRPQSQPGLSLSGAGVDTVNLF